MGKKLIEDIEKLEELEDEANKQKNIILKALDAFNRVWNRLFHG